MQVETEKTARVTGKISGLEPDGSLKIRNEHGEFVTVRLGMFACARSHDILSLEVKPCLTTCAMIYRFTKTSRMTCLRNRRPRPNQPWPHDAARAEARFMGMTAQQRFLSVMLLITVCVMGVLAMVITGRMGF